MQESYVLKLRAGNLLYPMTVTPKDGRLYLRFKYNEYLKDEVKVMSGARWDPESKQWHITNNQRNLFALQFLAGGNPFAPYEAPLKPFEPRRWWVMDHQKEMGAHAITRQYCIFACEMGTGKTLTMIEVMEQSGFLDWWWCGPRNAVFSVKNEFKKWAICAKCGKTQKRIYLGEKILEPCSCPVFLSHGNVVPKFLSYEELKKEVEQWPKGKIPPQGIVYDESSRGKNPTAQRTMAMQAMADEIREYWKDKGYVVEMSGSPAPKDPGDWWSQCLSGNTLVLTTDGPKSIKSLTSPGNLLVDQKKYQHSKSWQTGVRQTFKIETKEGYEICATDNHRFLVTYFDGLTLWKEVKEIVPGDQIVLHDHKGTTWDGFGTFDEGYVLGHWYGDGSARRNVKDNFFLCLWEKDFSLLPYLQKLLPDSTYQTVQNGRITLHSKTLTALIREYGEQFSVEGFSSDFHAGYIAGLFDTDGSVEQGRARFSIGQSDRDFLQKIQQVLLFLGIRATLHKGTMKDSEIDVRVVKKTEQPWKLNISGEYAHRFQNQIHFQLGYKRLNAVKNYGVLHNQAQVTSVTLCGEEPVFDINVPIANRFSANGFMSHNCEIARPGFIREGNIHKFRQRLCVIENRENTITGGTYPHLVTWLDDARKCKQCGHIEDHPGHNLGAGGHLFSGSRDEVSYLYKRMSGLVLVRLKKDCLNLPDKVYETIELEPTSEMKRAASIIESKSPSVAQALTLLRELSDGFQYADEDVGQTMTCPRCHGTKIEETFVYSGPDDKYDDIMLAQSLGQQIPDGMFTKHEQTCDHCNGTGEVARLVRKALEVPTPKEAALKAQLDLHEDVGRIVIFGGFTGSIDRIVNICRASSWHIIRVDGRGWDSTLQGSPERLLEIFQEREVDNIAFVSQPSSGGLGLNLTASPTIVYWSNDFNAESRIQSEDRIHRPGMDLNRGAKIVDLVCLKSDAMVINNLKRKRRLQDLTLGEMREEIAAIRFTDIRNY